MSEYCLKVDEDTLNFEITKDGESLPFSEFQNVLWGVQNVIAVIKRTESEIERRKKLIDRN